MLDIKLIRETPELVRQALEKRGESPDRIGTLDSILEIDGRYRSLLRQTEELRATHNESSKQLSKSKEKPPQLIAQLRQLGEQISSLQQECMVGSGNLPKFGDNLYHDEEDDFWFIPTAEVPLTNLHRDEILSADSLPLHYVAYTPCFRREKMAAGTDTRGIKRGHQFDKVELYKVTDPESSDEALEELVADAEDICRKLDIPHRVVQLCTGDLGFAACKTYDIEMWAPGCAEWLEVSSCSNCGDFQARRANIRYRPEPGAKPQLVHTLNGSGLALPRVLIAVLENYQQADGTVLIPEVLESYLRTT